MSRANGGRSTAAGAGDGPPAKLCECGCGQPAPISRQTSSSRGNLKGQPTRFINGHNTRGRIGDRHPNWKGDAVGYGGLHMWVAQHKDKTGICASCDAEVGTARRRGTEWANVSGRYLRDLGDFVELCIPCHRARDRAARSARAASRARSD